MSVQAVQEVPLECIGSALARARCAIERIEQVVTGLENTIVGGQVMPHPEETPSDGLRDAMVSTALRLDKLEGRLESLAHALSE